MTATAHPADTLQVSVEQHSLTETIALHLFPGLLFTMFYVFAGVPVAATLGWSTMKVFNLGVLVIVLPVQLGLMLYLGYASTGKLSLDGIILFREKTPEARIALLVTGVAIWGAFVLMTIGQVDSFLFKKAFSWVPAAYLLSWDAPQQSQSARLTVILQGLLLSGILAPFVEELYFRGFLLPRMSRFGIWAVVLNAGLYSLYQMWNPWLALTRFILVLPLVYVVWLTRNIRISIWFHCVTSTFSIFMVLMAQLMLGMSGNSN